jgi:hypothetical protein
VVTSSAEEATPPGLSAAAAPWLESAAVRQPGARAGCGEGGAGSGSSGMRHESGSVLSSTIRDLDLESSLASLSLGLSSGLS